jgi:hypothetical protein
MYIIIGASWSSSWQVPSWAFPGVLDDAQRYAMLFNGTAAREITGLTNLWKYIANRYANVPNVMFEFMNEPFLTSSTDYLAGSGYENFNEHLISAIESVETNSHLKLVEAVYDSQDDWVELTSGTKDIQKSNVVWVMHYYSPVSSYDPNGSYSVGESFTWNGVNFQPGSYNGSTYIAWRIIRIANMVHGWNKPLLNDEFSKDTTQANWQSWLSSVMQVTTQYQVAGWWYFCYTHNTGTETGWNLNIASVANAVMPILDLYMTVTPAPIPITSSTSQQTTTATAESTTTMTSIGSSAGMGWAFALIGIGIGVAAAGGGLGVALSGRQYPQVFTYYGQYYCVRHRVPVWYVEGRLWCPVERRYLRY